METQYSISYNHSFNVSTQSTRHNDRNAVEKYLFTSSVIPSNIFVLARAFLSISSMTNNKLQKLCYYAKAWYLALYDENLISEQFQAWVHGAVQPALYQRYKKYGYDNIPKIDNPGGIPEHFISFAKEIYDSYGGFTGTQLEKLNHQEDPWINARGACNPWENCFNEISENDMKDFYRKQIKT